MSNLIQNKFTKAGIHLDLPRNVFDFKKTHTTNVLTGKIVPMMNEWVLPASSYTLGHALSIRSAPIARPILDSIYVDVCVFWCPYRILMTDTPQWLGENQTDAWTLKQDVKLPTITEVKGLIYTPISVNPPSYASYAYIADHYLAPHIGFRNPKGANSASANNASIFKGGFSVLPSRAYDMCYNYFWRDENLIDPILFSKASGANNVLDITNYGVQLGKLHYASRIANMWNKLLPSPQRGDAVTIDLLGYAPVITRDENVDPWAVGSGADGIFTQTDLEENGLRWYGIPFGEVEMEDKIGADLLGLTSSGGAGAPFFTGVNGEVVDSSGTYSDTAVVPANLWVDLRNVSAMSINQLRWSIMMQHYLEKSAAAGARASEFYASFWGLKSTHQDDDIPKLIIQKRYRINVSQVLSQTKSDIYNSADDETETIGNLGDIGAYSLTAIKDKSFAETFTEYGIFQYHVCIRHDDSFAYGIDRHFGQNGLLDNYLTSFDHVGEMLYEKAEIAAFSVSTGSGFGLGYNRAWSADRYQTDSVVGILAPNEPEEAWTLARAIDTSFSLNQNFIEQKFYEFDRALLFPVAHGVSNVDAEGIPYESDRYQWLVSLCVFGKTAKTMSKDSEPGIIGRL